MSYAEDASAIYSEKFKAIGLAPAHVRGVKESIEKELKRTKGDKKAAAAAARAYLKERKLPTASQESPAAAAPAKKPAKSKDKEAPVPAEQTLADIEEGSIKVRPEGAAKVDFAKDALVAAGVPGAVMAGSRSAGVPAGNIDLRQLDAPTAKALLRSLEITPAKDAALPDLQKQLALALVNADATARKRVETITTPAVITKLSDCVSVMLDLSNVQCIVCPRQEQCRKLFYQHTLEGFVAFRFLAVLAEQDAVPPKETKAEIAAAKAEIAEAEPTKPKAAAKHRDDDDYEKATTKHREDDKPAKPPVDKKPAAAATDAPPAIEPKIAWRTPIAVYDVKPEKWHQELQADGYTALVAHIIDEVPASLRDLGALILDAGENPPGWSDNQVVQWFIDRLVESRIVRFE